MSDALEYQFQATDRRVRDLDSRLDDLEGDHQNLKSRFGYTDDLDYELRDIRSDISECETTAERIDGRVDELGDRVDTAERAVKRLTQHVRLLEGQIMAAGKIPAADLDTFTKDQRALARTMQSGWNAGDALLGSDVRALHRARVQRFRDAQTRHRTTQGEVVGLVGTLVSNRYGTQTHAQAATQLRTAIATEATRRQDLTRQAPEAHKAAEGRCQVEGSLNSRFRVGA
ncbi:hypothetical protein ACFWD7_55820 [Streptomyces mirabilis]|uniref:hypothetical protein n=1 Tax=Streptomyces mirabilis TaxID=68239 RepID=UPI0036C43C5F